jgi:hypothetical protein
VKTEAPATSEAPVVIEAAGLTGVSGVTGELANTEAPGVNEADPSPGIRELDLQPQERFEDELIMHLERDQFVAETSRPVPRAVLSARATAGLWALRVFVVLVSVMVIYTFVDQLH